MKTESTILPNPFTLEDLGDGRCLLTFCENVVTLPDNEQELDSSVAKYQYDEYRLEAKSRDGLFASIENNQAEWLQAAKDAEINALAKEVRKKRDGLLTKSDKYVLPDFPITNEQRALVMDYRRALREIPEQDGFPHEVIWPEPVL